MKRTGVLIAVLATVALVPAPGEAAPDQPPTAEVRRASSSGPAERPSPSGPAELSLATLLARARGGQVVSARIDDMPRTVSGELAGVGATGPSTRSASPTS
jgi:hypothetical protein